MPVTERLVGIRESAEQAVHTHPNDDEERLEQMSHPKNQGDGTEDAPRKVDLLGSGWLGYGKVWLVMEEKGVLGPQCSPQTQRVRLVSVWV